MLTKVNETLRSIISSLEKNNSHTQGIIDLYKDVDFKLLFSEENLKINKDDFTKNILWLIVDKQSNFYKAFVVNRLGWVKTILDFKANGNAQYSWPEVDKAYAHTIEKKKYYFLRIQK